MNRSASRGLFRTSLALFGAAVASTALTTAASAAVPAAASHDAHAGARAAAEHGCAVVWFDLGETLVHTAEDSSTGYMPGAAAYLRELRERNIDVGLITNVPSSWGETDAERAAALKKEVDGTWKGSVPFAWEDFGDRILTPRAEAERKPAPALWERAKGDANGCRLVYEAETADETDVAASLGYVAYQVGQPSRPAYLPVRVIERLAHDS
ncbi:hypothetical protein DB35_09465 [Streptomyces abyssalis]|uniref:HAD family hydrolase n=1 Tax=Streptomyces abyssalis TaxID=933944 RepID=A0A1E7JRT7_9ACTN|nr:hypothetical protein [Streptomyces abyssalis]OEU91591.1 hypothetical protein AN215_03350 [Streptomyces abyssalis]OEU94273.1 hypothetical protein DB35_09465 [Streptomyces abyssalis]